ncbi:MAG: outer membrane protein [Hyphomicrobium sp.]|uniref:outer membrane protein n=1 Tax=Hyphomicrobium sp. TaxID=82 RepID=UPI003D12D497
MKSPRLWLALLASAAALSALLVAAPAQAGNNWAGCYVGVHGGYAVADHDVSVPGLFGLDGISGEGAQGGPVVGCDFTAGQVVVGAFADYAFRSVDTTVTLGGSQASVGLEDAWSAGLRAGWLFTPQTLVYGLVSYQSTEVDDLGIGLLSDLDGIGWGGGLETELGGGLTLRGEYRFVDYDTARIGGLVDLDTNEHQARVGVVYRFWSGGAPAAFALPGAAPSK